MGRQQTAKELVDVNRRVDQLSDFCRDGLRPDELTIAGDVIAREVTKDADEFVHDKSVILGELARVAVVVHNGQTASQAGFHLDGGERTRCAQ